MNNQGREINDKLQQALDTVEDEKTFLQFMAALAGNWDAEQEIEQVTPSSPYEPGALGWDSGTIGAYLWAAHAWGDASSDNLPAYKKPDNVWRRVADILYVGKIYE